MLGAAVKGVRSITFTPKVLLMDDEKGIRDVAGQILEHLGCEVAIAANGEEAVELFREAKKSESPFDLLIIDMSIPGGMSGIETMRIIQGIDPDARAVLSTGYTDTDIVDDYHQLGFSGIMPKPYRIGDIRNLLKDLIPGYAGGS